MRIAVNRDLCIGAGQCVLTLPELFDQDEADGRVRPRTQDPHVSDGDAHALHHLCPTGALRLVSDDPDGTDVPERTDDPERTEP